MLVKISIKTFYYNIQYRFTRYAVLTPDIVLTPYRNVVYSLSIWDTTSFIAKNKLISTDWWPIFFIYCNMQQQNIPIFHLWFQKPCAHGAMSFKFGTFYPSLKIYSMFSPHYSRIWDVEFTNFSITIKSCKKSYTRAHSYDAITIFIIYSLAKIRRIRFYATSTGWFCVFRGESNNRKKSICFYFIYLRI